MTSWAWLLIFSVGGVSFAETWITVHGESSRLKECTSCTRAAKEDQRAVCDCCMVKNVDVLGYNAAEAANRCTSAYSCVFDQAVYYNLDVARQTVAYSRLRLKSMTIANMDNFADTLNLPEDGILTGENIVDILHVLNSDGLLNLPAYLFAKNAEGERNIFARPLGDNDKGFYSGQLFFVGYKDFIVDKSGAVEQKTVPLYIAKETNKGVSEIGNLYQIGASRLRNERINTYDKHFGKRTEETSTIAQIAFDDLHFKLKSNGHTRYFSLLQTAPGKSFNNYLRDFGKLAQSVETDDEQYQNAFTKINYIFYRIGFAMSKLHQKYADTTDKRKGPLKPTFVHGDLHSQNIFYDELSDQVTLIDNETFSMSLKRPSLGIDDIVEFYMLHTVKTIAHTVSFQLINNREFGIHDGLWHELWCALFDGYLSAYGNLSQEQFAELYADFKDEFYGGFSQLRIFRNLHNLTDQRKLKRFGPSLRRSKIMHEELAEVFERLLAQKSQQFESEGNGV